MCVAGTSLAFESAAFAALHASAADACVTADAPIPFMSCVGESCNGQEGGAATVAHETEGPADCSAMKASKRGSPEDAKDAVLGRAVLGGAVAGGSACGGSSAALASLEACLRPCAAWSLAMTEAGILSPLASMHLAASNALGLTTHFLPPE